MPEFTRVLKSEIFEVKRIVNEALRYINVKIPSISEDDKYELKLIFNELLYNAVIHGNKSDSRKRILLFIDVDNLEVKSTITDEGKGYNYKKLLKSNINSAGEHGRGVKLVNELASKLEFNLEGNSVRFKKRVSLGG